jgi:hypothetical protein
MAKLFIIKRDERLLILAVAVWLGFFQFLMISKFWPLFSNYGVTTWTVFMKNYHMSGFDPYSYAVLTSWGEHFDIIRHPLLALFLYPFYGINQGLLAVTGANCAPLVMGVLLLVCSVYGSLFLYRLLQEVMGVGRKTAMLLVFFFLSFAYILVSTVVADHFAISMMLLLLTLYRGGVLMQRGERFTLIEACLLFIVTAGVTLSNGVIVGLIVWFVNGRSFFRPKFLILGFIVPSVLLLGGAQAYKWSRGQRQTPIESQLKDTYHNEANGEILWENFFGESVQLHRKHVLGDVLVCRPIIVKYNWWWQYAAEVIYVSLFVLGMVCGLYHKSSRRFFGLMLSLLAYTVLLHVVLGFGLNEVYIMSAHWIYAIPLAISSLYSLRKTWALATLNGLIACLTLYLLIYNGTLLFRYLTWSLVM